MGFGDGATLTPVWSYRLEDTELTPEWCETMTFRASVT